MRKSLVLALLVLMFAVGSAAAAQKPTREVFGLRLGMSEEAVHERLRKIARQQKEEKEEEEGGEQEVWILKHDAKSDYLLTRFNEEHRLILITVVAQLQQVRYADLASLHDASKATDGVNYSYKWKVAATKQQPAFLIIARGSEAEFLTSYSLYLAR